MRRKRYQITDRLEKKIWEVQIDGSILTTRFWVRKNSPARVNDREMESPEAARKEMDRLCRERDDQDYVLVESVDDAPRAVKAGAEMTRLEKSIFKTPESVEPYMVYGDWLSEQNDPLGRLIAVQIKRVEKPRDRALKDEETLLLREHDGEWLGELSGEAGFEASWKWGFLDEVRFGRKEEVACAMDPIVALSALFRLPTARFLRGLVLGDFGNEDDFSYAPEADYDELLDGLGKMKDVPPTLRRFGIEPQRVRPPNASIGRIDAIYPRMQKLESLWLKGTDINLGATIDLPALRIFEMSSRYPAVAALASSKLPKLETLKLDYRVSSMNLADLIPVVSGEATPSLRRLELKNLFEGDGVLKSLGDSPLVKKGQLVVLDLTGADISAEGTQWLVENAAKFSKVERLNLTHVIAPEATVNELRKIFGKRLKMGNGYTGRRPAATEADSEDRFDEIEE